MLSDNIKSIIVESQSGHCPLKFDDAIILTVTHEKPQSISVDEIRHALIDTIGLKPIGCAAKVYMIPDAQLMTPGAQNALLKTLEEPPEYARIVLITDNAQSLLETIRSRCILIRDDNETEGTDSETAEANGRYFTELFSHGVDSVRAGEIAREIIARGPNGPQEFCCAVREYLLAEAQNRSGPIARDRLISPLNALDKAEKRLKFNVNTELTLEMMLMEI